MGIFNFKKDDDKPEAAAKTKAEAVVKAEPKKETPVKKVDAVAVAEKTSKQFYGVILKPVVTERTSALNALNQYVFEVANKANKIMIAEAVLARYGVKPIRINVCVYPGKVIRRGRSFGRTRSWKKAIVTLPVGKSISLYEGPAK